MRLPLIWSIFQGNFCQVPDMYYGPQIELSSTTIDRALAILQQSKTISVCLNDSFKTREEEVPELESKLIEAFTRKFPEKSSFEK